MYFYKNKPYVESKLKRLLKEVKKQKISYPNIKNGIDRKFEN